MSEHEWVERERRTKRTWMWRNWEGHYEGTEPPSSDAVAVMYRDDFSETGIILGAYPELGDIYAQAGEPVTTRIIPRYERGKWVKIEPKMPPVP